MRPKPFPGEYDSTWPQFVEDFQKSRSGVFPLLGRWWYAGAPAYRGLNEVVKRDFAPELLVLLSSIFFSSHPVLQLCPKTRSSLAVTHLFDAFLCDLLCKMVRLPTPCIVVGLTHDQ